MATAAEKSSETARGQFYVEDSCIDCDLCRQTAPQFFARKMIGITGRSVVTRQPSTGLEQAKCLEALQACPVEAIKVG